MDKIKSNKIASGVIALVILVLLLGFLYYSNQNSTKTTNSSESSDTVVTNDDQRIVEEYSAENNPQLEENEVKELSITPLEIESQVGSDIELPSKILEFKNKQTEFITIKNENKTLEEIEIEFKNLESNSPIVNKYNEIRETLGNINPTFYSTLGEKILEDYSSIYLRFDWANAYPDYSDEFLNFNSKGEIVELSDVLSSEEIEKYLSEIETYQRDIYEFNNADGNLPPLEAYDSKNLEFLLLEDIIVLYYHVDFPHTLDSLEPFPWFSVELKK